MASGSSCGAHGYRHSGTLLTTGHHTSESGVIGEISGYLGGMNGGHAWIVRYDLILTIAWAGQRLLRVNSGTYTLNELEMLT